MSDENMTNNEETAALFVSAQKKKKAEEEAKKKAAEEQAKRDAAEAEVRRMEQEVEERKRKAEEERIALEKAEQERTSKKAEIEKAIKNGVAEGEKAVKKTVEGAKDAGSSAAGLLSGKKLPILIGAGVAVIAVIVILAVVLGGSKKVSFEDMQFDTEVVSADSAYDIAVVYPASEYPTVNETILDGGTMLEFIPDSNKKVFTDVIFTPLSGDDGKAYVTGDMSFVSPKKVVSKLTDNAALCLGQVYGETDIKNGVSSIDSIESADGTYEFFYNFFFTADALSGTGIGVVKQNGKGEYICEYFISTQETEDTSDIDTMVAKFADNNTSDAWKIPGYNTVSTNKGELQKINEIHMGFDLTDRFEAYSKLNVNDGGTLYADGNGATVSVSFAGAENDAATILATKDAFIMGMMDTYNKQGIDRNINLEGIQFDRKYESEYIYGDDEFDLAFYTDYAVSYEGISYWERDFMMAWVDPETSKIYYVEFMFMAPSTQKSDYQKIYDSLIDSLTTI